MFESPVAEKLEAYVYALIDPRTDRPFYIGKGRDNRVFSHAACALVAPNASDKYDTIREIVNSGREVRHLILRHGMTDQAALDVESALIDFCSVINQPITNIVLGHGASAFGAMTADEIIRKYQAVPLSKIEEGFVLININKTYKRAKGQKSYYEATKESWAINKSRTPTLKYALSEYKGFIVEVFKIVEWYSVEAKDKNGKPRTRWGFDGIVAEVEVRNCYLNKSVKKAQGAANPIRYSYASKA
ncbi:MAG: hypothetical protein Q7U05_03085 [Polaromonas sp.]|nr:hypothetical protein [Polaromonas sp.]